MTSSKPRRPGSVCRRPAAGRPGARNGCSYSFAIGLDHTRTFAPGGRQRGLTTRVAHAYMAGLWEPRPFRRRNREPAPASHRERRPGSPPVSRPPGAADRDAPVLSASPRTPFSAGQKQRKRRRKTPETAVIASLRMPVETWQRLKLQAVAERSDMRTIILRGVEAELRGRQLGGTKSGECGR